MHAILPAARKADITELQRIQDKAMGFPLRPYHYPSLVQYTPGELDMPHWSVPEPSGDSKQWALQLVDVDTSEPPGEWIQRITPQERGTLLAALATAVPAKPPDWAVAEAVAVEIEKGPKP